MTSLSAQATSREGVTLSWSTESETNSAGFHIWRGESEDAIDRRITTALIPGRPAPKLIKAETVAAMKPGAVIVDLAVEQGGNVEGSKADKIVDARGTSCPGPILAAKKGIPSVSVGGIMEVQATDSGTTKDLPAWAKKMGHEYMGVVEEPGFMRLFVKKMK